MEKIQCRISEIGTVVGGGTPSTKNPIYWGGDIPWISPKDLTDYKSTYISHGENFLTEKGLKSGTRLLPKDTVLFSSRAPIGYVALAANPICTNQGFKSIVCDKNKVEPLYLYYYLKANLDYIKLFGTGATFPEISGKTMGKIKIEIHKSLGTQCRIASILSTYDTLIENNTKRILLLEKMAENLYKEWFVRFRFPGHEKVEMENGLPKGWTVEKVKDWCRVFTGRKDVNQTKEDGQYVFFSCSPNTFHSDEFIYDGKAILVAGNGSYTGRTRYFEGKFDLYQRTYAVVSNKEDDSFMFYLYLRFKFDFEPMHSGGTRGSAIPYIVMKDLTKYKFLYKEDIVEEYIKKVKPMFAEIDNLQQQNILLARQRDLLLPRLMSGKLEV